MKTIKTRFEIYNLAYNHMLYLYLDTIVPSSDMDGERFRAHASHKANVFAVQNTERLYHEQFKNKTL